MFQNLRRDLERDCQDTGRLRYFKRLLHPGVQAIALYPCARALRLMPQPFWWIGALVMFIPRYFVSTIYGIMIPINADIGPGFVIHTWGGGAFIPCYKIGRTFTIVGGGLLMDYGTKEIGDDVWVGTGVKGVGKIRIGNRVRLASNTVGKVLRSVPRLLRVRRRAGPPPPGSTADE